MIASNRALTLKNFDLLRNIASGKQSDPSVGQSMARIILGNWFRGSFTDNRLQVLAAQMMAKYDRGVDRTHAFAGYMDHLSQIRQEYSPRFLN